MWQLIAVVLSAVMLFYLFAFYLSVVAWLNAIGHLLKGNFTRAAAWFCVGSGMLFWWYGTDTIPDPLDFHEWLKGSAVIVGIGALASLVRFCKKQQAMRAVPTIPEIPTWPTPSGSIAPVIKLKVERERG
jgi:hypothetical protein